MDGWVGAGADDPAGGTDADMEASAVRETKEISDLSSGISSSAPSRTSGEG